MNCDHEGNGIRRQATLRFVTPNGLPSALPTSVAVILLLTMQCGGSG